MASQNKWDEANTIIGFEMKLKDAAEGWWTFFKEDHPNSSKKWNLMKKWNSWNNIPKKQLESKFKEPLKKSNNETNEDVYSFAIRVSKNCLRSPTKNGLWPG